MSDDSKPISLNRQFTIPVADRVLRLPPYLFAKINKLMYEKRRAGADVIDLGMGNPSDAPEPMVIDKLIEAAQDAKNHGYSHSLGLASLRREVASKYFKHYGVRLDPESEVVACLGSKEGFSHICLALMGPGDTAIVPAPSYPAHIYAVALAAGNEILLDVADPEKFLSNVAFTCQHLYPKPKLLIVNFPHNPSATTVEPEFFVEVVQLAKRYELMVISDFAYADVAYDGYQPPSFLSTPGAIEVGVEFTTMSKGYNMAGWRVGFCAGNAEMVLRPVDNQDVLRLWYVCPDPDRRDSGPQAHRRRRGTAVARLPGPPRRALRRAGTARLADHASAGVDVRLGQDARRLGEPDVVD